MPSPWGGEAGQGNGHTAPQTGSACSGFCPVLTGGHHAVPSGEGLGSDLSEANTLGRTTGELAFARLAQSAAWLGPG